MKFFPTNINLNVNIPKLNLKSNIIAHSNDSQFLNCLNLLLTKSQQKGFQGEKNVTGNEMSLAFLFLLLMTSNRKTNQHNLIENGINVQFTGLKKNSYVELNKLLDLFKKEIENDPELKKLMNKLQQHLDIKKYKKIWDVNIDNILKKFDKTIVEGNKRNEIFFSRQKIYNNADEIDDTINLDSLLNKLYRQLNLDGNKNDRKIINIDENKKMVKDNSNKKNIEIKKINQLIKDINNYIKYNHSKVVSEIDKFIRMNLANKKDMNVIPNDKLEPDKRELRDSLDENNLRLVIEKLDKINEQIKNISQNISSLNKEEKYLDLENIKNQIAELQKKVLDIVKENRGSLKKGQMQERIEQIVHDIESAKDRIDRIDGQLLKAEMEMQSDKRLLKSGRNKGFDHANDFAAGPQIRSFVLDKGNQGVSVPVDSKFRDEIFRQIETGIFKNLGEGRREVSIKLHPPELGALKVVMQVHNKEVSMVLHTEHRDVADALNKHIANFEKSFEQQGLKVVKVEVKNDLFSGGENSLRDFTGSRDHAQNNSFGFKRRNLFDFSLVGEGDISAIDHEDMANLVRMNSGSLYVVA